MKGLVQPLPETGLCGSSVAQVSGKWGLLPTLVTCCLVAGTLLLPAQALHRLPAPSGHKDLCPTPWLGLEKNCEALRVISRLYQGCGYIKAGDSSSPGHQWARDVLCSGEELLWAVWPGQETVT